MFPSEARAEALQLHVDIRNAIARMLEAVDRIEGGGPVRQSGVYEAFVPFESVAIRHLAVEEGHVLPLIETGDAWGPMRREQLLAAHASQREGIERVRDLLAVPLPEGQAIVETIKKLSVDVLSSLSWVEDNLLGPTVLRDNSAAIDQEAG